MGERVPRVSTKDGRVHRGSEGAVHKGLLLSSCSFEHHALRYMYCII
jgi:hypothetical protein